MRVELGMQDLLEGRSHPPRRLQGCSLSLAPCAQGCSFSPSPRVQGCSSLIPKTHLQGFFGLRAQRKVGKPELLLPSLCWGGDETVFCTLLYLRGFLPEGVKVSGVQSQRAKHMAPVRLTALSCRLP